jgi:hypothetical protein
MTPTVIPRCRCTVNELEALDDYVTGRKCVKSLVIDVVRERVRDEANRMRMLKCVKRRCIWIWRGEMHRYKVLRHTHISAQNAQK